MTWIIVFGSSRLYLKAPAKKMFYHLIVRSCDSMPAMLQSLWHNKAQYTVFSPKGKSTKPVSLSQFSPCFFDVNFCFPSLPPIKKV